MTNRTALYLTLGILIGMPACADKVTPARLRNQDSGAGATGTGGTFNTGGNGTGAGPVATGGTPTATTGGTTSTGGATNTAATGGAGGSGGTSTGGSGSDGPPAIGDLVVLYRDGDAGSANNNDLKPQFQVQNIGSEPVRLASLTIRYWYTTDGSPGGPGDQQVTFDWAELGNGNITGSFGPLDPAEPDADYYLEVGFSTGNQELAGGASTGEIHARANWTNYTQPFDETNDYSYDPTKTAYAEWHRVTLYDDGALVWGREPDGTVPTLPGDAGPTDAGTGGGSGDAGRGGTEGGAPNTDAAPTDAGRD